MEGTRDVRNSLGQIGSSFRTCWPIAGHRGRVLDGSVCPGDETATRSLKADSTGTKVSLSSSSAEGDSSPPC